MRKQAKDRQGASLSSEAQESIKSAREVLRIESEAVAKLSQRVGGDFARAVELVLRCTGRVIITGIGKSGIVGKKIAATLTSTGTSTIFLHPAEGVHGDLGMVLKNDLVICISKSGDTDEITKLIPMFKKIGVPIITMTGNLRSALAQRSDVVLDVGVDEEACPHDLAPTASTTATMAMGDALAVALLKRRNFKSEDFAFLHPGGSLGKKLIKIEELMFTGEHLPRISLNAGLQDIISEITRKRFGCTCVTDDDGVLKGIITDGDLRRLLQNPAGLKNVVAGEVMNPHVKVIRAGSQASKALDLMKQHNIMQVVVIDDTYRAVGIVHLHDILEAGIKK
jgi:arabinose-5-phosphate isomerase